MDIFLKIESDSLIAGWSVYKRTGAPIGGLTDMETRTPIHGQWECINVDSHFTNFVHTSSSLCSRSISYNVKI